MNFPLFMRVLWRHKIILVIGLICAVLGAILSSYKLSGTSLAKREKPTFQSESRVLVGENQVGFFRTLTKIPVPPTLPNQRVDTEEGYDPQELAEIYTYLVVSDEVKSRVEAAYGGFKAGESFSASRLTDVPDSEGGREEISPDRSVIPVVQITGKANTAVAAQRLTDVVTTTFLAYVDEQQNVAQIPPEQRVALSITQKAQPGESDEKDPMGTMVIVFLGILSGFVALIFLLESGSRTKRATTAGEGLVPGMALIPVELAGELTAAQPRQLSTAENGSATAQQRPVEEPAAEARTDTQERRTEEPAMTGTAQEEPLAQHLAAEARAETAAEPAAPAAHEADEPLPEDWMAADWVAREDERVAQEQIADERVAREPVADEQVTEDQVAEDRVAAEEPVADEERVAAAAAETRQERNLREESVLARSRPLLRPGTHHDREHHRMHWDKEHLQELVKRAMHLLEGEERRRNHHHDES